MKKAWKLFFCSLVTVIPLSADAALIINQGALAEDVTEVRTSRPLDDTTRAVADGFTFSAMAGDLVTLSVNRLTSYFDAYLSLFLGDITGTDLNPFSSSALAAADDNLLELPGFEGWFADPQINTNITTTGIYTAVVTCAGCEQIPVDGARLVNYQITLGTPPGGPVIVPLPASVALFGIGLAGLGWTCRKRA